MFKGRLVIVPGMQSKLVRVFSKIVPDKIIARVTYKIQEKRR